MATGRIAGTGEAKILGVFPGTKPTNWCGEYAAAEIRPEEVQ